MIQKERKANMETSKIKFDFSLKNKDCDSCITCPACNGENVHFMRTLKVEFDNEKSTGIAIQFFCEEGHFFYQLFETYKGYTQTAFTDDTTVLKKIIVKDIDFESAPISLQKALQLEDLEEKYFFLDEYGRKAVDSILDIELLRSLSEQPNIDIETIMGK